MSNEKKPRGERKKAKKAKRDGREHSNAIKKNEQNSSAVIIEKERDRERFSRVTLSSSYPVNRSETISETTRLQGDCVLIMNRYV